MSDITITARIRRDGALAIPRKARELLGLQEGDKVEITVHKPDVQVASTASDPLLALIGLGKGGPDDGAENHDSRLYGPPPA